jgi:hypothetical protein
MNRITLNELKLLKAALLSHIKQLRENMIQCGMKEGLSNEKTINLSQELDQYIYLYQCIKNRYNELASV